MSCSGTGKRVFLFHCDVWWLQIEAFLTRPLAAHPIDFTMPDAAAPVTRLWSNLCAKENLSRKKIELENWLLAEMHEDDNCHQGPYPSNY